MANNNTLKKRNEQTKTLASGRSGTHKANRSLKRKLAKEFARTESKKPLRMRLGLTKH